MNQGIGNKDYYDKYYSKRDWRFYKFILHDIIEYAKPGRILDLGAGCGFIIEAAYSWGWDCIGIEGSKDAIELMKLRNSNLKCLHQPLSKNLPFDDAIFSVVILNEVIEHLEGSIQDHILIESYRVLDKGGMLIINAPSKFNKRELKADPTHINLLTPSEMEDKLINTGFVNLIDKNSPLLLDKRFYFLNKITKWLFKKYKFARISATTSYIAFKN